MRSLLRAGALLAALSLPAAAAVSPLHKVGDDRIRQTMIQQSLHGACPCPWSLTRHQHPCGKASQYSHARPPRTTLCYATDISDRMVAAWRNRHDVHPPVP